MYARRGVGCRSYVVSMKNYLVLLIFVLLSMALLYFYFLFLLPLIAGLVALLIFHWK